MSITAQLPEIHAILYYSDPVKKSQGITRLLARRAFGGVCNGTSKYEGCNTSISDVEEYLYLEGTGNYWHHACANANGLYVGMVAYATGSACQWAPIVMPPSSPNSLKIEPPGFLLSRLRTQKAKGIAALDNTLLPTLPTVIIQDVKELRHIPEVLRRFSTAKVSTLWARPCPTRPRHGFVESRAVTSTRDISRVWKETRQADPEGELLLQPLVEATTNGILTPNSLVWGAGNDGATAGRNATLYRLGATRRDILTRDALRAANVHSQKESPYVEIVWEGDRQPLFVQLRSGPKVEAKRNYIPRRMKVRSVYVLKEEEHSSVQALLAWEKLTTQFPKGTAVVHVGGALTSHFGIHCVLNKVPYLTDFIPEVGQIIVPETAETNLDVTAVRAGILRGTEVPAFLESSSRENYRDALLYSMFILHNVNHERGPLGATAIGAAASLLFRVMSAACLGEMRHFQNTHPTTMHEHLQEPWLKEMLSVLYSGAPSRQSVFARAWTMHHAELVHYMANTTHAMLKFKWGPSMGGLNWGRCALSAMRLHEALTHVVMKPSERSVQYLIQRMNSTVNLVHNGGSLFNKFVKQPELNRAATLDRTILLKQVFPMLQYLQRTTSQPLPAFDIKPRAWKKSVPREYVRYADNKFALKRCHDESGDINVFMTKRVLREVFYHWTRAIQARDTHEKTYLIEALYGQLYSPLFKNCVTCGKPRRIHPLAAQYCYHDHEGWRAAHQRSRRKLGRAVEQMQLVIDFRALETTPGQYIVDRPTILSWWLDDQGKIIVGFRYIDTNEIAFREGELS